MKLRPLPERILRMIAETPMTSERIRAVIPGTAKAHANRTIEYLRTEGLIALKWGKWRTTLAGRRALPAGAGSERAGAREAARPAPLDGFGAAGRGLDARADREGAQPPHGAGDEPIPAPGYVVEGGGARFDLRAEAAETAPRIRGRKAVEAAGAVIAGRR